MSEAVRPLEHTGKGVYDHRMDSKRRLFAILVASGLTGCGDDGATGDDAGIDASTSAPHCANFEGSWVASLGLVPDPGCALEDETSRMNLAVTQNLCEVSIFDDDLEATFTGVADHTGINVAASSVLVDDGADAPTAEIRAFRLEMGADRLTGAAQFILQGGELDGCTDVREKLLGTPNAARMCQAVGACSTSANCCADAVCVDTTDPNTGYCLGTCSLDADCGGAYCCRPIPWNIRGDTKTGRYCTDQCGGGNTGNACSECLSSCRGRPSCCTGTGCICDSAC